MISGLPGMPTTTDTRPPATAGPRLRNLKLALISALEPDAAAMAGAAAANAAHSNAKVETQIGNLRNSSSSLINILRLPKNTLALRVRWAKGIGYGDSRADYRVSAVHGKVRPPAGSGVGLSGRTSRGFRISSAPAPAGCRAHQHQGGDVHRQRRNAVIQTNEVLRQQRQQFDDVAVRERQQGEQRDAASQPGKDPGRGDQPARRKSEHQRRK